MLSQSLVVDFRRRQLQVTSVFLPCCSLSTDVSLTASPWNWSTSSRQCFLGLPRGVSCIIIPAKKVMFSSLFDCMFVCLLATLCKNFRTDLHEVFGPMDKRLNFGGDPDQGSAYGYGSGYGFMSRYW